MSTTFSFFIGTNKLFLNISLLLIRLITGLILYIAGAGKVFAWYGGYGLKKTLEAFWTMMRINAFWAYVCSYTELIGGLLLMIGLLTRPAAFFVTINMAVATIYVGPKNFFAGQGVFPFILMICSLAILLVGPGSFSIDALVFRKKGRVARN